MKKKFRKIVMINEPLFYGVFLYGILCLSCGTNKATTPGSSSDCNESTEDNWKIGTLSSGKDGVLKCQNSQWGVGNFGENQAGCAEEGFSVKISADKKIVTCENTAGELSIQYLDGSRNSLNNCTSAEEDTWRVGYPKVGEKGVLRCHNSSWGDNFEQRAGCTEDGFSVKISADKKIISCENTAGELSIQYFDGNRNDLNSCTSAEEDTWRVGYPEVGKKGALQCQSNSWGSTSSYRKLCDAGKTMTISSDKKAATCI